MFRFFATGLGLVSASALAGAALFVSHEAVAFGPRLAPSVLLPGMPFDAGGLPRDRGRVVQAPIPARVGPTPGQCRGTRPMRVVVLQVEARPGAASSVAAAGRFAPTDAPRPVSRGTGRDPHATVMLAQVAVPSSPEPQQTVGRIPRPVPDPNSLSATSNERKPKPRPPWDLWDPVALGVYF